MRIVCLCGSTKFKKEYEEANLDLTLKGWIVLSVGGFSHADLIEFTNEQKAFLDALHFEKIRLAEMVFIINVEGYIGNSTRREIQYARLLEKKITYLERLK